MHEPDDREDDFCLCQQMDKMCTTDGTGVECAIEDETCKKVIQTNFKDHSNTSETFFLTPSSLYVIFYFQMEP
jgi:hypothetical protein